MSENIPKGLRYSADHTWVRNVSAGLVEVGITDHAQSSVGDMVSAELPSVGQALQAGVRGAVVESTKTASDVISPVSGTVTTINSALADTPELLNDDPYGKGWLFQVKTSSEPGNLLSAADYQKLLAT